MGTQHHAIPNRGAHLAPINTTVDVVKPRRTYQPARLFAYHRGVIEAPTYQHACGFCGNPAEQGHLCLICDATTVRALTLLAPLVADLRSLMTDVKAVPTDRIVVDTSREQHMPSLEHGEQAHRLYATVADWAVSWIPHTDSAGPAHLARHDARYAVTQLPEGMVAFTAATRVASWLIGHHDVIKMHEDSPRYALDVVNAIDREAGALGYRPQRRRVKGKRCRLCRDYTLMLSWPLNGTPVLKCRACGGEFECGATLARMTVSKQ